MVDLNKSPLFSHRKRQDRYDNGEVSRRFYDARFGANAIMVLPGRHYVTSSTEEMIVTILGSCVAACIRDPIAAVGGLNHFLLPESDNGRWGNVANAAMRYGNHAMETLINDVIKRGGLRSRLEVKVFGGAHVIEGAVTIAVGQKNAEFVENYISNERLHLAAKHLGGTMPRRIHYFPVTGKVKMRLLQRSSDKNLFEKEMEYRKKIDLETDDRDEEIFE